MEIGIGAFADCNSLECVEIPQSTLLRMGKSTFDAYDSIDYWAVDNYYILYNYDRFPAFIRR